MKEAVQVALATASYDTIGQKKFYAVQGMLKAASTEDIRNMPSPLMAMLMMQMERVLAALTDERERRNKLEIRKQQRDQAREEFIRGTYEVVMGNTTR